MKLVIGLGNPGLEYERTRHNIGYMFLDYLTEDEKYVVNKKFNAMEYEETINGERILFVKPTTFMNSSGIAVSKYVNYYKIDQNDIVVIQDDLDMTTGKYKLLYNRGDGGHNGIKSIINALNSREFLRLKIGISKATADTKDYVLGNFTKKEMELINESFSKLDNFVLDFISMNRDRLMAKYNLRDKEER